MASEKLMRPGTLAAESRRADLAKEHKKKTLNEVCILDNTIWLWIAHLCACDMQTVAKIYFSPTLIICVNLARPLFLGELLFKEGLTNSCTTAF